MRITTILYVLFCTLTGCAAPQSARCSSDLECSRLETSEYLAAEAERINAARAEIAAARTRE